MAVLKGMAFKEGAVGESSVAHGAGESAFNAVCAHVHIERALLGEAFGADSTLEGADPSVDHHVLE